MRKGTREEASCLQHLGTGTLCSARKCADVSAFAYCTYQTQSSTSKLLPFFQCVFNFCWVARPDGELKGKFLPLPHLLESDRPHKHNFEWSDLLKDAAILVRQKGINSCRAGSSVRRNKRQNLCVRETEVQRCAFFPPTTPPALPAAVMLCARARAAPCV